MTWSWELLNIFVAAVVVYKVWRGVSIDAYYLLFIYCSLHFTFAAMPMMTGEPFEDVVRPHYVGGGALSMVAASVVLVATIVAMYVKASALSTRVGVFLAGSLIFVAAGYLVSLRLGDWMQLKNAVATALVLVLMTSVALMRMEINLQHMTAEKTNILLVLLATMLVVAFNEVYTLRAWAYFTDSTGVIMRRASSLLFNPNLYGMWCALIAILFSLLYMEQRRRFSLFALALAFGGIYLSGSRSAAFLLLFVLTGVALFSDWLPARVRWAPLALMLLVLVAMGLGAGLASAWYQFNDGWRAVAVIGERFAIYPFQLTAYLLNELGWGGDFYVPPEITVSIEGRFEDGLKDSGWLVLYDDLGWLGVIGFAGVWFVLGWLGVRTYLRRRDLSSIYALAVFVFSVGLGFVLRFQAFPTAVFVGIALAPCVAYWAGHHAAEDGNV